MSMASACISQTSRPLPNKDSTLAIPISQLFRAIIWIERGKLCEQENALLEQYIDNQREQIYAKDSAIAVYKRNERDYKTMITYYKDMYNNYEDITKNLDENLKIHQKFIRRQKINRYLYALAGIGVGILIAK